MVCKSLQLLQSQLTKRGIGADRQNTSADWFYEPVYPVFSNADWNEKTMLDLIDNPYNFTNKGNRLISAADIADEVNLYRQYDQRNSFLKGNLYSMASNWKKSVFYQLDLKNAAAIYQKVGLPLSPELSENAPLLTRLHDQMFRRVH